MEKVLLAIDGIAPDRKVFQYTIELCKRIKAELSVFQIIGRKNYSKYLKKIKKTANHARMYIEGSMTAAAFAQAGEHETAKGIMAEASEQIKLLLSESEREGVHCHFSMKFGAPEKEIIDYVNHHRDVVLTVYDASVQDSRRSGDILNEKGTSVELKGPLSVPLVIVKRR
jgi:hypothetical protein